MELEPLYFHLSLFIPYVLMVDLAAQIRALGHRSGLRSAAANKLGAGKRSSVSGRFFIIALNDFLIM
jgi:hypothetical protein